MQSVESMTALMLQLCAALSMCHALPHTTLTRTFSRHVPLAKRAFGAVEELLQQRWTIIASWTAQWHMMSTGS